MRKTGTGSHSPFCRNLGGRDVYKRQAEHKALFCYEHGEQMTPENARKYSRLHPRCGTNYLFLVMIVSIVIFSLLGVQANPFLRAGIRILMIPLVAGVAYEVLKLFARQNNILAKIVRAPGLALDVYKRQAVHREVPWKV